MNDLTNMIEAQPLATTVDYYASKLPENEKAISFLKSNRLASDVTLKIGFADRTFGKQLPNHRTGPGRELRSVLQKAGILKATGHETFRGFVTVPLSDSKGTVTGVYGLRTDRKLPGEKRIAIGSGIFNAAALQSFGEIILCDSVLAAWTFYGSGYPYAVADVHGQLTIDDLCRVRRVLVVGDVDMRVLEGKEVLRIHFPDGVSVNEYAKDRHVSEDAIGIRVRAASWVGGHVDPQSATEKPATETSLLPTPRSDLHAESNEHETTIRIENRRWRIRGLDRNATIGVLKINLMVLSETNDRYHVDSLDLYHARSRRVFLKEAVDETAASEHELRSDLGRVLLKLEELQIEQLQRGPAHNTQVELSATERDEALSLLTDERLLDRILIDFETCGIVGEEPGKLAGYLAATSRLLDKPLGLVIQSSSAAGKSALADSVLRFMPPEEQFACSAMTSQSLYYLGNENLRHKILSVAEEEGVRDAAYQLKLLQSEGHLSLVSTSKESGSGRTTTERYEVDGPVALVMTTTSLDVDPELLNRCLVVAIDESVTQTAAIHAQQRFAETMEGWEQELQGKQVITLHQNAQRLLRRLPVFNPYANQLGFVGSQTRHRRDHKKYLSLIKAVALLFQYQHELKTVTIGSDTIEYIEVTRADIAKANTIADWALGRSIDELAGPTRRLLVALYDWVRASGKEQGLDPGEVVFTRRQAREALGWNATQFAFHLEQLCRFEYAVRCGRGNGKLCRYGMLYDGRGREGQAALIGLVDAACLIDPETVPTKTDLSA